MDVVSGEDHYQVRDRRERNGGDTEKGMVEIQRNEWWRYRERNGRDTEKDERRN